MQSTPCRSTLSRRAGLTLIEVAIAMVVFVIGALAIIQIFPPLLGAIQNSENRTVASRLADSTLSRLHDNPNLIPDAIYNADSAGEFISPGSTVTGTAALHESLPDDARGFDNSALSKFRRIVGERHMVRSGTAGNFVLTQFPFENGSVSVYTEDELKDVYIGTDGRLDFRNARRASNNQYFGSPPPSLLTDPWRPLTTARTGYIYYVSYRWTEGGAVHGVIDEPVAFPEDAGWDTDKTGRVIAGLSNTAIPGPVLSGPVSVRYRALQSIGTLPASPERGYLPLAGIAAGTEVSIDYTVRDWRWIVDERVLDQQPEPDTEASYVASLTEPRYVRLPVRNVEDEPDLQAFGLLWDRAWNSTTRTVDYTFTMPDLSPRTDAENGLVYYEGNSLNAPLVRTIVRTVDNWTHQLSVASRSYVPYFAVTGRPAATAPREEWREYYVDRTTDTAKTFLCFHSGEAGKTLSVSYTVGSVIHNNKVITINAERQPRSTYSIPNAFFENDVGVSTGASEVAVVELPANATLLSVRGLDIRARTAWINGDRWAQTVLTGYRPQ